MQRNKAAPARNRFHSLCPYFAMFPEAFAERWIDQLTDEGDTVIDVFSGRGTAPFQALLMGRNAIANDINPVAYCVTRAKTNIPKASRLRWRISVLERAYDAAVWDTAAEALPEFFRVAYSPDTLRQILFLRSRLKWRRSDGDCMLAALILGALHGESSRSPSYLSNQMPRTISPKPAYSLRWWERTGHTAPRRDAFGLLREKVAFRYASAAPEGRARVFNEDVRALPSRALTVAPARLAITSPPYLDVTSYEEDQWLRLWFLGGPDHPARGWLATDDRHTVEAKYWDFLSDTWAVLGEMLDEKAHVVMRIGSPSQTAADVVEALEGSSASAGRSVALVSYETSDIKHRQTSTFRPGAPGCSFETDVHFSLK